MPAGRHGVRIDSTQVGHAMTRQHLPRSQFLSRDHLPQPPRWSLGEDTVPTFCGVHSILRIQIFETDCLNNPSGSPDLKNFGTILVIFGFR
jgi:hypothetical protein